MTPSEINERKQISTNEQAHKGSGDSEGGGLTL